MSDDLQPWETCSYSGIAHACFLIAVDNDGINRDRSTMQWRYDYETWIDKMIDQALGAIDLWLISLTAEQLDTVCCGEQSEADAILALAPPGTGDLLDDYFDEVC